MYAGYQDCKVKGQARLASVLKPTAEDVEGPFYKPGAPYRHDLAERDETVLVLSGRVLDLSGAGVKKATLDFWQCDGEGRYDMEGFRHRGVVCARADGTWVLRTTVPGNYLIGENEHRCAHVHVKVVAPGFKPLTTQLYFADDPHNSGDHWFDPARVVSAEGHFDFVLERLPEP